MPHNGQSSTAAQRAVLVVEGWQPLSMNALERLFLHDRHGYRKAWMGAVMAYWHQVGRPTFSHPSITIRCYYKVKRTRDADNAAGGVGKIVMDALKGRAFADDDAGSVDLRPVQLLVDRANPRVEIELQEAT